MPRAKASKPEKPKIEMPVRNLGGAPAFPWTSELEDEICEYIATHAFSLKKCQTNNKHWPELNAIFERMHKSPRFGEGYQVAKQSQVAALNEETLAVLDEVKENPELGVWAKEAIKQYNWQSARLKPKTFGDKVFSEVKTIPHEATLDELA